MIGIKFLFTFVQVALYFAVAMLLVYLFFVVVTYAIRFLVSGFKWSLQDHWDWVKTMTPRRKKTKSFVYKVTNPDGKYVGLFEDPEFWASRGYEIEQVERKDE